MKNRKTKRVDIEDAKVEITAALRGLTPTQVKNVLALFLNLYCVKCGRWRDDSNRDCCFTPAIVDPQSSPTVQ